MYKEFTKGDVAIMLCSECNTDCPHCYIGYTGHFEYEKLMNRLLIWKDVFNVVLNGSEPLLNPSYLDAFELLGQKNILSNGIVLYNNDGMYDLLKRKGITNIGISYHFQCHNLLSRVLEETVFRVIKESSNRKFNVTLNCTVTPYNYDRIVDNCKKAYELGAKGIHFTNYMNHGKNNTIGRSYIISYEQRFEFFKQLSLARNMFDIDELKISRCGTFEKDIYTNHDNFFCGIYEYGLAVAPDDKVYPCVFLNSPREEIGFVRDNKIYIKDDLKLECEKCAAFQRCCIK